MTDWIHPTGEQTASFLLLQAMNKIGCVVNVGVTVPVNRTVRTQWPTTTVISPKLMTHTYQNETQSGENSSCKHK